VPWYYRARAAINAATPFLVPTQAANLALLVSAILKKRTLCLSELARTYPTPKKRRVVAPKHDLLHRFKRLWRFTNNERVEALEVHPMAFVRGAHCRPVGLSSPVGFGHRLDLLRHHPALRLSDALSQVLRIAIPRKGRAIAAFATGLRPGQPPGDQEPEPARAGCLAGRG
jgi:hypothetical protein